MRLPLLLTLALVGCQAPSEPLTDTAEGGRRVALTQGCMSCHSDNGQAGVGPTWKGLYGSTVILNDGKKVVANKKYIYESINRPQAKIVKGFSPVMPAYRLGSTQLHSLALYIESLK